MKINELGIDFREKTSIFAVEITRKRSGNTCKTNGNGWKTKENKFKMGQYKQNIIPKTSIPEEWKYLTSKELRNVVLEKAKGLVSEKVKNIDTGILIEFSVTNARKLSRGGSIYLKKAALVPILPELIRVAEYSNFGQRKETDNPEVLGFLNFKAKCLIDGKAEFVRLSVQFCRRNRFFYNVEVNKIKLLPQKPRGKL